MLTIGLAFENFDNVLLAQLAEGVNLETIMVSAGKEGSKETGYKPVTTDTAGPFGNRAILDTPYSINVMSKELLESAGVTTVDEVLRLNPLVQLSYPSDRVIAMYNIRGFMLSQTSGRLLDGMRKYSYLFPLEDKERIEVISGLSGFLYGPAAVGGSINYVMKRPTPEKFGSIKFSVNERGGTSSHLDLGGPIGEKGRFGYRLNIAGRLGHTSVKDQTNENLILSSAFDFKATENLLLKLNVYQYRSHMEDISAVFTIRRGKRPKAFDPNSDISHGGGNESVSNGYILGADWKINDIMAFRAGFQQSDENMKFRIYRYITVTDGAITSNVLNTNIDRVRANQLSGYAYLDIKIPTGPVNHEITLGYSQDKTAIFTGPRAAAVTQSSDTVYQNFIFGDIVSFGDKFQLIGGLSRSEIDVHTFSRNDYYNTFKLSPSVSLVYKPIPNLTLYSTYMESLEQGTFVSNVNGGRTYTNNGEYLSPFQSVQYELGAKAELGNVFLTLALYDIEKDYTVDIPVDLGNNLYTKTQDGRERHRGVELTATGKITNNLTIYSGLTFMKARVEKAVDKSIENKRPTNTAEKMFKMFLEYDLPFLEGLAVNGGFFYTGPSYGDTVNTDKMPGYAIYDLGASYATEVKGMPVKFNFTVHNLADKHYWQNSSYLGAPRTFLLTAQIRFL
jgi:iron complex outermembrane receptor protein